MSARLTALAVSMSGALACSEIRTSPLGPDDLQSTIPSTASAGSEQPGPADADASDAMESGQDALGTPAVLASGVGSPVGMVLDDEEVFVTSRDSKASVYAVSLQGAGKRVVAPFDIDDGVNPAAGDLGLYGSRVYWLNEAWPGGVFSAAKSGGDLREERGTEIGTAFAMAGDHIYWAEEFSSYSVWTRDLVSGSERLVAKTQIRVGGLAADANAVAWTAGGAAYNGKAALRMAQASAPPVDLYTGAAPGVLGKVLMTTSHVVWIDQERGRILRVDRAGGPSDEIARGLDQPMSLAIDGASVYFTVAGLGPHEGWVGRVPLQGGPIRVLADKQPKPWGIVVNTTHVLWANHASGEILRLDKPSP